tara:strand:+ start:561 stop:788 length:228 start_codon:yes stop_codon:yes gene_type:complete
MNFSQKQIDLISNLITEKVRFNNEDIRYCRNYINDQFLMEETKEEIEKNKNECQKQIRRISNECQQLMEIFSLLN